MINDSSHSTKPPLCAIVGAGPGNGAAFALKFAKEGYAVALIVRNTAAGEMLAEVSGLFFCELSDNRKNYRFSAPHSGEAMFKMGAT